MLRTAFPDVNKIPNILRVLSLFCMLIMTNLYLACTRNPVNLLQILEAIMFSPAVIHYFDCT